MFRTQLSIHPEDEDEEPWDQRRTKKSVHYEEVEEGELPSLSSSSRPDPSGNMQQRGGDLEQRKFWGQLDTNSYEQDDEDAESEDASMIRRDDMDDMPDDELIMSSRKNNNKSSQHRALRNTPRQSDEHYEAESYPEDRLLTSGFCDSTLTAIGDMCGAGYTPSKKRVTLSPRVLSDVQEEHTAIEVEFVEEETAPARHRPELSVESKNAYLSAMAAQAKEEYRKKGIDDEYDDENAGDSRPVRSTNATPSLDDADAYETFNAAEKRKFIRLINTGANPSEATQMILQERSTLKPEPPRKAPESVLPKRSHGDSKHRSHRSAVLFWKKSKYNQQNRSASAEPLRPTVSQDEQDEQLRQQLPNSSSYDKGVTQTDGEEVGGTFAKSGIHFYDAERKEEDEASVEAPNTPSSVRSTRSEQLRKVGFKSLAERRAKKTPTRVASIDQEDMAQRSSVDVASVRASPKEAARFVRMSEDDNDSMTDYDNILNTAESSGSFSKNASFDPEMTLDDIVAESQNVRQRVVPAEVMNDERSTELYANARKQYAGLNVPSVPASDESVYTAQTSDTGYTGVTGVTGVTTYSHSSRVRRPGAAKKRLAKEKELQEKAKGAQGWAQSIKEVAATTSQKWDPLLGWVDYLEPVVELPERVASQENMHLDLTRKISTPSKRSKMEDVGSVSTAKSAPLPFPREWEEEREKMLREAEKNEQLEAEKRAPGAPLQGILREGIPKDGLRPNSWIESMKAASANLAKDGKKWDPDKGWVNDDGTSMAISTDGDFTVASTVPPLPSSALTAEQAEKPEDPESPVVMDRIGAAPVVLPERYVQLGDTGSVRSVHQDLPAHGASTKFVSTQQIPSLYESTYVSDDDTDVDSVPLPPNGLETYPKEQREVSQTATNVDVVKEKISNEDMGLFASGANKSVIGHTGRTESFGSEGLPELFASKQQDDSADWSPEPDGNKAEPSHESPVQPASTEIKPAESNGRRGDGPVDLDDDLEDSVGTDARSIISTNTDGKSIASFKLRTNTRDTSPVTKRRQAEKSVVTPSPEAGEKADRNIFRDRHSSADTARQIGTIASHESYDQEMVDHHQSSPRSVTREEPVREVSPRIRNTVAEWESRATKTDGAPSSPTNNSAEWKVFLAKKVRAERDASSEVADRLDADRRPFSMPRQLFKSSHDDGDGYDDDSIFDFKSAVNAQSDSGVPTRTDRTPTSRFIAGRGSSQATTLPIKSDSSPLEDISHLSPINSRDEEDADQDDIRDIPASKVNGSETAKRVNFFQRLAECTGPVMPQNKGIPSSHLSFLQNNICGRPDDVHEDTASEDGILDKDIEKLEKGIVMDDVANVSFDDGTNDVNHQRKTDKKLDIKLARSKAGVGFGGNRSSAGSSVISEDTFGAKTAYLEALAMKAAVAKPRSRSRARSTSTSSVVSAASSAHSEKWKAFLERKKAGGAPSVISKASEKDSDERYKEMLSRLKSSPRQVEADEMSQSAKDLSGAKVEALMAQLTGSNVSEAEI